MTVDDANGTTVLIVDDEPDIALICRIALTMAGYEVDEAGSGAAALEYLADATPDVVLLDLRLPDLTGWEVLDRLRDAGLLDRLNVVVSSAEPQTARAALEAGCAGFLSKPFTPSELVEAVESAVGRKHPA